MGVDISSGNYVGFFGRKRFDGLSSCSTLCCVLLSSLCALDGVLGSGNYAGFLVEHVLTGLAAARHFAVFHYVLYAPLMVVPCLVAATMPGFLVELILTGLVAAVNSSLCP